MACSGFCRARKPAFWRRSTSARFPGVGKVTEKNLHAVGIRKVGDLARLDEAFLEQRFGQWGLALAGKARGMDAGGWFDDATSARAAAQVHQPRAHVRRRHGRRRRGVDAILARFSEMARRAACASMPSRRAPCSSSFATPIFPPSRARIRSTMQRSSTREPGGCVARASFIKTDWVNPSGCWASMRSRSNRVKGSIQSHLICSRAEDWRRTLAAVDKIRREVHCDGIVSLGCGNKRASGRGCTRIRKTCRARNRKSRRSPRTVKGCRCPSSCRSANEDFCPRKFRAGGAD